VVTLRVTTAAHKVPAEWHTRVVRVHLAGCGGNGCHLLMGLCQMQKALHGLGHPGLQVTAFDPDSVSEANLGRQLFTDCDLGQNKALALIHRLNIAFGLDWGAIPLAYRPHQAWPDLLISCVDSKQARAGIHDRIQDGHLHYWMDLGNGADYGQVVLGQAGASRKRLPNVADLYPEVLEGYENDAPSCSLAEALTHQELFINRTLSAFALHLVWSMFRRGEIRLAGCFLNLKQMTTVPIPLRVSEKPRRKHRRSRTR
jgi:PRTRC genetic system ThiF family protein